MSSIAGNTSTSASLAVGATATRTIDTAGDADWFAVNLLAGMSYGFTVQSNGGPGLGLVGPDLRLFDPIGVQLDSVSNFSAATATISYRAPTAGKYFVGVADYNNSQTGQYTVSWVASDNIRNDISSTRTLTANGSVSSKLDVAGDADWFKLAMTSGLSYGFEVSGGASTTPLTGPDLQIRDAAGNILDSRQTFSGTAADLSFHATATGNYLFSVSDANSDVGGYTVKWITTDTIQNNITTAQTLGRNSSTTSRIDVAGDSDWFKITMNAGESYGFQVLGSGTNQLQWGDLQLRDAQGNIIGSFNSFSASINTLGFTAATTGTFFISVNETDGDVGDYVLRNIGADTIRNNVSTSSRLADGSQLSSRVDMLGDADWHRVETQEGVTYKFTASGDGSVNDLANVTLVLRDAAGNIVGQFSGPNPNLTYLATGSGSVFIEVRGTGNSDTGGYQLSVVSNAGTLRGTSKGDRLQGGDGATVINGLDGSDRLNGGKGDDRLFGSNGKDRLFGEADNDRLYGGGGKDKLAGGSGNDRLEGEAGNDILTGGGGEDVFVFRTGAGADRITDFQDGADRIQINGGPSGFSGLTLTVDGENVRVAFGNVLITVADVTLNELTSADFIFG